VAKIILSSRTKLHTLLTKLDKIVAGQPTRSQVDRIAFYFHLLK